MKRTRIKTLACAFVILVLTVCTLCFASTASAEEPAMVTRAKIGNSNVAFNGKLRLAFTVDATMLTPDGVKLGIMVWDPDVTEPTKANCSYVNFNPKPYILLV